MSLQGRLMGKPSVIGTREITIAHSDDNANLNNDESLFESLVVLEFSLKVPPPAIQWILEKIKLSKSKGGAELLVCPIVDENHEVCTIRFCFFFYKKTSSFFLVSIVRWIWYWFAHVGKNKVCKKFSFICCWSKAYKCVHRFISWGLAWCSNNWPVEEEVKLVEVVIRNLAFTVRLLVTDWSNNL